MSVNKPPQSPLMKIADAARYIGMSQSWLKNHWNLIPYVRIDDKVKRWRKEDLDAFIQKNIHGGGQK